MWQPDKHYNEDDFVEMIKGKSILYIPIVSSINRETNLYNLDSDGNINRLATTFLLYSSYKNLSIVLPKRHDPENTSIVDAFKKDAFIRDKIDIHYSDYFGIHAGEQRANMYLITNLVDELIRAYGDLNKSFDYVIADSQYLLEYLVDYNYADKSKLIFWNYLCSTNNFSRSFTKSLDKITEKIIHKIDHTIVTSPDIYRYVDYLNNMPGAKNTEPDSIIYLPIFVDRRLSPFSRYEKDKEISDVLDNCIENNDYVIYLPFRLTDEAYKFETVVKSFIGPINEQAKRNGHLIRILYSDPNNSGIMEEQVQTYEELQDTNIDFVKVSPARNTFYTIIDHQIGVNIPYFEDIDYANHAAIWEFKDSNANIWVLPLYDGMNMPYYEESDKKLFKSYKLLCDIS